MGYTTDFTGSFKIQPHLKDEDIAIFEFNSSREKWTTTRYDGSDWPTPNSRCQWVVNEIGTKLEWDGCEKFYYYENWLHYLVNTFFTARGYTVSGVVGYQGEDSADRGILRIENGKVTKETFAATPATALHYLLTTLETNTRFLNKDVRSAFELYKQAVDECEVTAPRDS